MTADDQTKDALLHAHSILSLLHHRGLVDSANNAHDVEVALAKVEAAIDGKPPREVFDQTWVEFEDTVGRTYDYRGKPTHDHTWDRSWWRRLLGLPAPGVRA